MKKIAAILALLAATPAFADWVYTASGTPVEIREEHVRVRVVDGVARKHVRLVMHNPNAAQIEAELFIELEPDQKVESFNVTIAGKKMEAELLQEEKARSIYEEIVRKQKDPALLEYYGHSLLRVRMFPIAPQSQFEAEVEMIQPLRADSGILRVTGLGVRSKTPLRRAACSIDISHSQPVGMVFSPSHEIDITRADARTVRVACDRKDSVPTGTMVVYYAAGQTDASVMAHDGVFMLTITPPAAAREPLPRDIVFCIDVSGSMLEGGKIQQVRTALDKFLDTLAPADRFNIVAFSTETTQFARDLAPADARPHARKFVAALSARGGTNIDEALAKAAAHSFRKEAVPIVVFLTDGNPTIGERDTEKLLARAGKNARIFCFGVGFDLNTQLLDRLAIENGGDRQYIHPKEDASVILENFAKKIDAPILASPRVEIEGATEIYPRRIPDVFRGGQLVILGRATGSRKVTLQAGETRLEWTLDFSARGPFDFVPRLWAIQKVDFLMDEIRKRGTAKELVDEIVALSKQYLIVTPYTSFLIVEDTPHATSKAGANFDESFAKGFNGESEWNRARNQMDWRGAYNVEAQQRACSEAIGRDAQEVCRQVYARNFVNRGGNWVDTGFDEKVQAQEIAFLSDDYFKLLRSAPESRKFLALGRNVTFQCNNQWYRVN
jgi:Ca-activated chloride channel family protein